MSIENIKEKIRDVKDFPQKESSSEISQQYLKTKTVYMPLVKN